MRILTSFLVFAVLGVSTAASANPCLDFLFSQFRSLRDYEGPREIQVLRGARITSSLKAFASRTEAGTLIVRDAMTPQGRPMHYEYIKPLPGHPTVIMPHGLLDDLTKMDGLAKEAAARGDGVLRPDLQGFGESYRELMKMTGNKIPQDPERYFYYENNVHDIATLVGQLGIRDTYVIGHSYGGAMAWLTTLALEKEGTKVRELVMLAPYVERIDGYLEKSALSGRAAANQTLTIAGEALKATGVRSEHADHAVLAAKEESLNKRAPIRPWIDALYHNYTKAMDPIRDSAYLDQTMYSRYRDHLVHRMGKTEDALTAEESADIDRRVKIAIHVTKGIRSFDLLNTSTLLNIPHAPMTVMWGLKDTLIPPDEVQEFVVRLKRAGKQDVKGFIVPDGNHFFPYTEGPAIFSTIGTAR